MFITDKEPTRRHQSSSQQPSQSNLPILRTICMHVTTGFEAITSSIKYIILIRCDKHIGD